MEIECTNLATYNSFGIIGNEKISNKIKKIIQECGIGSCGPRNFFGTHGIIFVTLIYFRISFKIRKKNIRIFRS